MVTNRSQGFGEGERKYQPHIKMEATLSQASNVPLIGELALNLEAQPRAPYVSGRANITGCCPQDVITRKGTIVMQFTIADSLAW